MILQFCLQMIPLTLRTCHMTLKCNRDHKFTPSNDEILLWWWTHWTRKLYPRWVKRRNVPQCCSGVRVHKVNHTNSHSNSPRQCSGVLLTISQHVESRSKLVSGIVPFVGFLVRTTSEPYIPSRILFVCLSWCEDFLFLHNRRIYRGDHLPVLPRGHQLRRGSSPPQLWTNIRYRLDMISELWMEYISIVHPPQRFSWGSNKDSKGTSPCLGYMSMKET